jgi:hypothetical protein
MTVNSVVAAKAGRLVRASVRDNKSLYTNSWGHLYLPDVVKAVKERYGFVDVPESLFELEVSETRAATFRHGKFTYDDSRSVLISQLEVYTNWVIATTQSSTDDADAFLRDIITWFSGTFFTVITTSHLTYLSQLEVALAALYGDRASFLDRARVTFASALASYNKTEPPDVKMSGFSLHYDTTQRPHDVAATPFTIERRVGQPYNNNVYYSQAPLKTMDHVALLTEIERGLTERYVDVD